MLDYIYKSPMIALLLYVIALIVFIIFVIFKIKRKNLFTFYNISIYVMAFTYLFSTPFQFQNKAWYALGYYNSELFKPYLYKSIIINFLGFIIFLTAEMYFEKRNKFKFNNFCLKIENICCGKTIIISFIPIAIAWLFIVYTYGEGIPLFTGNRAFYYDKAIISPIYQALNQLIGIIALWFGLSFISNKKHLGFFIFSAFLSTATAHRSTFLLSILYPVILIYFLKKNKKIDLKFIFKIVIIFFLLVILALILSAIRSSQGSNISINGIISSLLYGNTFCDIRDGAYLFYGFENNTNSEFIHGKTYMASLISFIPSSVSKFRYKWTWGRYSTIYLFNGQWTNHFGFRGGNSFEAYVNFGLPGVIIFSIISAKLTAEIENGFNIKFLEPIKENKPIAKNSIFFFILLSTVKGLFNVSSGMSELFIILLYLFMVNIFYIFMYKGAHIKLRNNKIAETIK